jgi:uncharacterized protein YecT (DUF1311 family)
MAYLRLSSASNDNWTPRDDHDPRETWGQRRYGVMPPRRRRRGGNLFLGLIAMPMGVWGLWLLLGTEVPEPAPRPLVFQAPPSDASLAAPPLADAPLTVVAHAPRGLRIVLTQDVRPVIHPETWGALPTAAGMPVVATPLADAAPAENTAGCRDAPTLAAQMTCIDPTLREAEQRMAAAYEAVLAAGVSPAALGRSQARWLATRDEMARASPEDLLAAYQTRESQLRSFAAALALRAGSVGLAQASGDQPRAFTGAAPST